MMSAVNTSSSARPQGLLRWVERCWPRILQAIRSETENFATTWSTPRRRARLNSTPRQPLSGSASLASGPTQSCADARSFSRVPSAASPGHPSGRRTPLRQREYVKCVTPIVRTASPTDLPCDSRTSTWSSSRRSLPACASSGAFHGGPLFRGQTKSAGRPMSPTSTRRSISAVGPAWPRTTAIPTIRPSAAPPREKRPPFLQRKNLRLLFRNAAKERRRPRFLFDLAPALFAGREHVADRETRMNSQHTWQR